MAIRLPLTTVLSYSDAGTSSIATGTIKTFQLPQDTDNVVLKLVSSITGGGVSATLQTTDDGGSTWYDVGRTSIVSDATNANAQWISAPVIGAGIGTAVVQTTASVYTATIGSAASSTLGQNRMSGLPILSQLGRVVLGYTSPGTANTNVVVQVKTNSQAAHS